MMKIPGSIKWTALIILIIYTIYDASRKIQADGLTTWAVVYVPAFTILIIFYLADGRLTRSYARRVFGYITLAALVILLIPRIVTGSQEFSSTGILYNSLAALLLFGVFFWSKAKYTSWTGKKTLNQKKVEEGD